MAETKLRKNKYVLQGKQVFHGRNAMLLLDGVELFDSMDAIREVTPEELTSLLEQAFSEECETLSVVRPLSEKE